MSETGVVGAGTLADPPRAAHRRATPPARSLAITWLPVVVPLAIVMTGAWCYRWVQEDAFINFRIIDNVVNGYGPVFNVGERVEVYSDPLWVALLTLFRWALPVVSVEWWSVVFGLLGTGLGVALSGRAVQRMAGRQTGATVIPVGLIVFSVVAGVWEFATSGLEMGMVFAWIGLSFWLLVRAAERRDSVLWPAFVMGLGTLIRPELLVMTVAYLAGLAAVVGLPGWTGRRRWLGRWALPLALAFALPVLYQLFRMAYFAMVVSNTALAKSAGAAWWSQGFTYLWNFVSPYALWIPGLLLAPLFAWWVVRIRRHGDRLGLILLGTPLVASLLDTLYVVHVGGDYMHARLLLPAFLSGCLVLFVATDDLRPWAVGLLVGVGVWAVVCAGWLRFNAGPTGVNRVGISNERNNWIAATKNPHPITAQDYSKALSYAAAEALNGVARRTPAGTKRMLVITNPYAPVTAVRPVSARSALPFSLAADVYADGVIGYLTTPDVYLFDLYSLANPIGSHMLVSHHGRPGHQKFIGPTWMVARFGQPGAPPPAGGGSPSSVAAARRALSCDPLRSYLHAITSPLTWSQAWSDAVHSLGWTTMSFPAAPAGAESVLCRSG